MAGQPMAARQSLAAVEMSLDNNLESNLDLDNVVEPVVANILIDASHFHAEHGKCPMAAIVEFVAEIVAAAETVIAAETAEAVVVDHDITTASLIWPRKICCQMDVQLSER